MTTSDLLQTHEDRRVQRWGGLAGVLGGALLIVIFGIVGAFVGTFASPDAEVAAYPDVRDRKSTRLNSSHH